MTTVSIRGGGIAACCCLRLLEQAGFGVVRESADRAKLPAIMLSETTQRLLQDVFERKDLLVGLHRIRRRAVLWGESTEPTLVPHSALVVSEQELLDRIAAAHASDEREEPDASQTEWEILAARLSAKESARTLVEHDFGSRIASALPVTLNTEAASDACWIESQGEGWLFLLPYNRRNGWVLAVGAAAATMLARSRFIAAQIREAGGEAGTFASHPRIAQPLGAPGWLACGSAALAFDPLCGDGAAHAMREAILGSAVICAASQGADVQSLVAHYHARLLAGFRRHLEVCREFYETGRCGPWWDKQVAELNRGLAWCSQHLDGNAGFRYRLNGFALEPIH